MSKESVINRENKRDRLVAKHQTHRKELKVLIKKSNDFDEIMEAQAKLAGLPRDSSPVRLTRRCKQCGRPHAVYRKFMLCRICLRQHLMTGDVTGGRKSSW